MEDYFSPLRERVEKEIAASVLLMGEKTKLRDACEYALTNGGKRFRPLIVLMIGDALGHGFDLIPSALAVEFFHTASLIADDLPCMDNDDLRRNKPSLHKAYGESVAILASYTLISHGYAYMHKNVEAMGKKMGFSSHSERVCAVSLETVSHLAGIFGATSGQFLDLFPPEPTLEGLEKIIYQKTISLFEISFVLGWLFAGGQEERLPQVKKCAYHLGMAFQIADDLQDLFQDKGHKSNIAVFLGKEKALLSFCREMASLRESLQKVGLYTEGFKILSSLLVETLRKNLPQSAAMSRTLDEISTH